MEQVVLARNDDQDPAEITTLDTYHREAMQRKYLDAFFMSDSDKQMFADPNIGAISSMSPGVYVSRASSKAAIDRGEMLPERREERLLDAKSTQLLRARF